MELQDFVMTTLVEIVKGVKNANDAIEETDKFQFIGEKVPDYYGQFVDFDVSVAARDKDEKGGSVKGGVYVIGAWLSGSANSKQEKASENVNRIKFRVFVKSDDIESE
ncbi:MAG: hypothetical protein ABI361_11750 [Nitrososphaera sp.]|jgi:hypothetical protein